MNTKVYTIALLLLLSCQWMSAQRDMISILDSVRVYGEDQDIPGMMISIVTSDSVLYGGGVGMANIERGEEVTKESLFRVGSVSKSFLAMGLLQAGAEGLLQLDTPIREIDPEMDFDNRWADSDPITVEHLLEHTAGFDDMHFNAIYNTKDSLPPSTEQLVSLHKNALYARWRPGTMMSYSNPGYIAAGHMLETVAGERYADYMFDRILAPLGMMSSGYYFREPTDDRKVAQGYQRLGGEVQPVTWTRIQGGPAGALCTNASDMSKYLQFMLRRGAPQMDTTVWTDDVFDRIEDPETSAGAKAGLRAGYGLGNSYSWRVNRLWHGHSGGIDGFSSLYVYSRDEDIGIAVSLNRMASAGAVVDLIIELLLGEYPDAQQSRRTINIPQINIPQEIQEQYAGFYTFRSPRNAILGFAERMFSGFDLVFADNYALVKAPFGRGRDTLYYAGDQQFYIGQDGVSSIVLFEDENGGPVFWRGSSMAKRESKIWRMGSTITWALGMIMPLGFFIMGLMGGIVKLFKRSRPSPAYWTLMIASMAYIVSTMGFVLSMENFQTAGTLHIWTALLFVGSVLLVPATIWAMYEVWRAKSGRFIKVSYWITAISLMIVSTFFVYNGFVGLRMWAY